MTPRVTAFFDGVDAVGRPEVWIDIRDRTSVTREASAADGPLTGLMLAVKNNVDVAGLPTTAACPGFAGGPADADAEAVARLRAAGATVVGSTNLDQFATGLVGQRSPYGGVRDARRPDHISGGSSSGSAVAVALGLADIAIGTDTAGSGRVPAAFQGIVGIKPTLGLVSTRGLVPACRSWDAVTIMARDLDTANSAMAQMAGGANARPVPHDAPLAAPPAPRVAVPAELPGMSASWTAAFSAVIDRLRADGVAVETIPFTPFLDAARLLYDGGLVAERHAAVGEFVDAHREASSGPARIDPTVGDIISAAGRVPGSRMVRDLARLDTLRAQALASLEGFDALLVPTAPGHPTIEAVRSDPIGVNSWLGTYTNFANLFDLCGVATPAGMAGDAQFGVTVLCRAFGDAVALDLARRVFVAPDAVAVPGAAGPLNPAGPWIEAAGASFVDLFVVGAHLPGQPLEHEMYSRGARYLGPARTAPSYRLYALDTTPPKPGLVHAHAGGVEIAGGIWRVPAAGFASFARSLPSPMALGPVALSDGRTMTGFGCAASALESATDITEYRGWLRYLGRDTPARTGAVEPNRPAAAITG
ncbi:allophanate hydrolase [Gordonia sp. KTR9]|uniref:allophanate hydrolase n=1 Tax=Gordonia sp. KTR9 TaxID=337191 RepID=UPI00027DE786|nr:allophanate hydrolase [Gordonia sp. KTR9]AFR50983.1 Asp-tRNAAsn/Glu-tRNAGln amidotransferase A subunit-related amidase [Gordonia sp. KTR9]